MVRQAPVQRRLDPHLAFRPMANALQARRDHARVVGEQNITGPEFVKALVEGGVRVESWTQEKPSLEDVYLELTGRKRG